MKRNIRKVLISLVSLLLAGIVAIVVWVKVNSRDLPAPDTSDLAIQDLSLSAQENAYTYFREAAESLRWPDKDSAVISIWLGETWDEEAVRQLLSDNQKMLDLVEQGLRCPGYQGLGASLSDDVRPHWNWIEMARVMDFRCRYELKTAGQEAALESGFRLLRFGSLIMSQAGSTRDFCIGLASMRMACDWLRHLLQESSPSETVLMNLSASLKTPSFDEGMAFALRSEYQYWSEAIDEVASGTSIANPSLGSQKPTKSGFVFHPNRTRAILSDYYRGLLGGVSCPYAELKLPGKISDWDVSGNLVKKLVQPNSMGRLFLSLAPDPNHLRSVFWQKCTVQCTLSGLRLIVACRLYEMKHGDRPDALSSLVPEFLEGVPMDPYDGKPFRYLRQQGLVFSVGSDLVDSTESGGQSGPGGANPMDDLVYPIYKQAEPAIPTGVL